MNTLHRTTKRPTNMNDDDKRIEDAHYRAMKRIQADKDDTIAPFYWAAIIFGSLLTIWLIWGMITFKPH
jgi:hypothetical protein